MKAGRLRRIIGVFKDCNHILSSLMNPNIWKSKVDFIKLEGDWINESTGNKRRLIILFSEIMGEEFKFIKAKNEDG